MEEDKDDVDRLKKIQRLNECKVELNEKVPAATAEYDGIQNYRIQLIGEQKRLDRTGRRVIFGVGLSTALLTLGLIKDLGAVYSICSGFLFGLAGLGAFKLIKDSYKLNVTKIEEIVDRHEKFQMLADECWDLEKEIKKISHEIYDEIEK